MRISNFGLRLIDFTYLKLNASNVLKTFFKNINICIVWTFLCFLCSNQPEAQIRFIIIIK